MINILDNDAGGLLQFSADNFNAAESNGLASITVTRTGGAVGTATVVFATSTGGTATAGQDYIATTGTLTFADGETVKTFTVALRDDITLESNETVNLTLSGATGGILGTPTTATLTIAENDFDPGLLLNEIKVNPPGTDNPFEFVELRGTAGATLANVYFLSVEGDTNGTGTADLVVNLSSFAIGSTGLLVIKAPTGGHTIPAGTTVVGVTAFEPARLENDANSFLVVISPTPLVQGTDYDPDDDGDLDLPAGAVLIDGIGWHNGDFPMDGLVYGGVDLTTPPFTSDAAARSQTTPAASPRTPGTAATCSATIPPR